MYGYYTEGLGGLEAHPINTVFKSTVMYHTSREDVRECVVLDEPVVR